MKVTLWKFPKSQGCMGCSNARLVNPEEYDDDLMACYVCLEGQDPQDNCNDSEDEE